MSKKQKPTLAEAIIKAIVTLNEPAGSTQDSIHKHIKSSGKANAKSLGAELKRMSGKKQLVKVKNTFKLAESIKKDMETITSKGKPAPDAVEQAAKTAKKAAVTARRTAEAGKKTGKKAEVVINKTQKVPAGSPKSPKAASPKAASPKPASPKKPSPDSFPPPKKTKTPTKTSQPKVSKKPVSKSSPKHVLSPRSKAISRKK